MAIIDDFKARFQNFNTSEVDTYLPLYTNNDLYKCYYQFDYGVDKCDDEIILLLLAHLLTIDLNDINGSNNGSTQKSVASESVGDVSVSYGEYKTDAINDDFFTTTRYGRAYLHLIKKNLGGVWI